MYSKVAPHLHPIAARNLGDVDAAAHHRARRVRDQSQVHIGRRVVRLLSGVRAFELVREIVNMTERREEPKQVRVANLLLEGDLDKLRAAAKELKGGHQEIPVHAMGVGRTLTTRGERTVTSVQEK